MFGGAIFRGEAVIKATPYGGVLVPKASVGTILTQNIRDLFNQPLFADGFVSVERIAKSQQGVPPERITELAETVANLAEAQVKLPESEQFVMRLEAGAAQVWNDVARYDGLLLSAPHWARDPAANAAVKSLRQLWTATSASADTLMQQHGIDKSFWYAAWAGRAAAVEIQLTQLEGKVHDLQGLAHDIGNLGPEAFETLAKGLEACWRVGIGFKIEHTHSPLQGAQVLAPMASGAVITTGPILRDNSSNPFMQKDEPLKSLQQLLEIVEKGTKLSMAAVRSAA